MFHYRIRYLHVYQTRPQISVTQCCARTRSNVHDSSAHAVSVWQHTRDTLIINRFYSAGSYMTNDVCIVCSYCVVVDQQVVGTVTIKFTSSQKS